MLFHSNCVQNIVQNRNIGRFQEVTVRKRLIFLAFSRANNSKEYFYKYFNYTPSASVHLKAKIDALT